MTPQGALFALTVVYRNFLIRACEHPAQNQRTAMILKKVDRMTHEARIPITIDADLLRRKFGIAPMAHACPQSPPDLF